MTSLEEILSWTEVDPVTGCRNWLRGTTGGYGEVRWQGRDHPVHRLVWELTFGPIPETQDVLHRCDNRRCCELFHLFLGTLQDNLQDCVAKGRNARGERVGSHKLTEVQVQEIRRLLVAREHSQAWVASTYGVCHVTISQIATGKTWKHLPWPQAKEGSP